MLGGASPRCRLERFSADLSDGQTRRVLLTRFGALRKKALVITEGLLVYLGADQSAELAKDLAAQPTFALWIVDIIAPFLLRILRRMARSSMSGSAELRFAPAEGAAFFAPYGWRLRVYRSSMIEGRRFNREGPGAWIGWLLFPRAARAELGRHSGPMTGTLLMERSVSQS
jgi:O-methyltransferase involved in polyketide biosynthesis